MNWIQIYLIVITVFLVLFHTINSISILKCKKLKKIIRYRILINLSLSDSMLLIISLVRGFSEQNFLDGDQEDASAWNMYFLLPSITFYTASLLSTLLITFDRYIAVIYCLRYRDLVTKFRLFVAIVTLWLFSIMVSFLFFFLSYYNKEVSRDSFPIALYLLFCVLLIVCSLTVRHIRNNHELDIRRNNNRFGVIAEKLNKLQRLSATIVDIVRLNFVTAALVALSNILVTIHVYLYHRKNQTIHMSFLVSTSLYTISNPFVYVGTMSELRQYYRNLLRCAPRRH